jgi:PAS domain S-box-containing protein
MPDKQGKKSSADGVDKLQERIDMLESELERTQSESDSLQRQLKLANAILDNSPSFATVKDNQGRYLLVNKSAQRIIGKSSEEILGKVPSDLYPPEIAEQIHRNDMEVLRTGRAITTEEQLRRDDGKFYYTTKVPLFDSDGEPEGMIGLAVDITKLKLAQQALCDSEELLSAIFNNAVVAMGLGRPDGRILRVNRQALEMFGFEQESEFLGQNLLDLTHPDFKEEHKELVARVSKGEISDSYHVEKKYLRKDGSEFWGDAYLYPTQKVSDGEPIVVVLVVDITERKEASLVLQRRADSERLLSRISSKFIKLDIKETDSGIKKALKEMGEFAGVDRSYVFLLSQVGMTASNTHEWCRQGVEPQIDRLQDLPVEGFGWTLKNILQQRTVVIDNVDEMPLEAEAEKEEYQREDIKSLIIVPLVSGDNVIGLAGLDAVRSQRKWSQDEVTLLQLVGNTIANALVRKRAEQALRDSEERFREMAEMLPQSLLEIDLNGVLTYHNRNAVAQLGYSPEDLRQGFEVLKLVVPEQREQVREYQDRLLKGEYFGLKQFNYRRKDGSTFPALINTVPLWENGVPSGARAVIVDISERQQLEEERRRSANLESVGLLAGGIAHDFNNILASIMGYINMAQIAGTSGEELADYLGSAETAAMRAKSLTQQLLTFSKGGKPVKSTTDVAQLILNSANLSLIGSNVKCDFAIDDALWPAEIDEGQIGQVLNNIIINAKQAMADGGVIKISAGNLMLDERNQTVPLKKGSYLEISISDTGGGIPKKHLDRIFEPYFTTKADGSGLGLATSYSIVVKHDGYIEVDSVAEQGTRFVIYLPASPGKQVSHGSQGGEENYSNGRVLLMDDEPELLEAVAGILEFYGSTVEMAKNGNEALGIYKAALEQDNPFDLVVMDLTIPGGMGGREAIARLLELDPDARAIVSSGYSDDAVLARFESYGFKGAISKPYNHKQLMDLVSKVLRD